MPRQLSGVKKTQSRKSGTSVKRNKTRRKKNTVVNDPIASTNSVNETASDTYGSSNLGVADTPDPVAYYGAQPMSTREVSIVMKDLTNLHKRITSNIDLLYEVNRYISMAMARVITVHNDLDQH